MRICLTTMLALLLLARGASAVESKYPQGDLHGFPSLSDENGKVIADGELTQKRVGEKLIVHARWRFHDGLIAEEDDQLTQKGGTLAQDSFRWVEKRKGVEQRRYEVDFTTGKALVVKRKGKGEGDKDRWDEQLDLPAGKAFAGYSTALAISQLRDALPDAQAKAELTFVAFTPKPRTVTLEISRHTGARVQAAGRELVADLYTLHPKIPFPVSIVAGAKDAHLWLTHDSPPSLLRAEQNLVEKDDPVVRINVIPSGPARPPPSARRGPNPRPPPR